MSFDVQGTFVSQKISKIRWVPEDYAETKCFLTGSWDDNANSVRVWTFENDNEENSLNEPQQLSEYKLIGDVTEIKFLDKKTIGVSSSEGDVRILEISVYDKRTPLREVYVWNKLHKYGLEPCSCSALDTLEGEIATAGEDGIVNILNSRRGDVSRNIKNADSCSIQAICYMRHNELITGNVRGHMKVWDLRVPSEKPSTSFLVTDDENAVTCIINHPTQPYIIIAGSESGVLAMWDLRAKSCPASLMNAHAAAITEIQFHPENPQKLLTCAASGEIWDWNVEMMTKSIKGPDTQTVTPFNEKSNMMVKSMMPTLHKSINSLDCDKARVLCGTDNEAVYLIRNVVY